MLLGKVQYLGYSSEMNHQETPILTTDDWVIALSVLEGEMRLAVCADLLYEAFF